MSNCMDTLIILNVMVAFVNMDIIGVLENVSMVMNTCVHLVLTR